MGVVGCDGGDETTQPTPDAAIDFGVPMPDAASLPFEPGGEPDIPGDERVYETAEASGSDAEAQ